MVCLVVWFLEKVDYVSTRAFKLTAFSGGQGDLKVEEYKRNAPQR